MDKYGYSADFNNYSKHISDTNLLDFPNSSKKLGKQLFVGDNWIL